MKYFGEFLSVCFLLLVFTGNAHGGGGKAATNPNWIEPFGGLNWSDNLVSVVSKLGKMGFEKITLTSSSSQLETINYSGVDNDKAVLALLVKALNNNQDNESGEGDSYHEGENAQLNLGDLSIQGGAVSIAGLPFNVTVKFVNSPGYAVIFPENVIFIDSPKNGQRMVSYAMSSLTMCDASRNQDRDRTFKSIIDLLDKKYQKYRKSDQEITKTLKSDLSAYAKVNHIKLNKQILEAAIKKELEKDKIYTDSSGTHIAVVRDDVYHASPDNSGVCFTYSATDSFIAYLGKEYAAYAKKVELDGIKKNFKGKRDMSNDL